MHHLPRAAHGSKSVPMGDAGVQQESRWDGGHTAMDSGNGLTAVGIGSATNRGLGLVIIMALGLMIQAMDGSGFPALNGRRHGSIGAWAVTISGGRLAVQPA